MTVATPKVGSAATMFSERLKEDRGKDRSSADSGSSNGSTALFSSSSTVSHRSILSRSGSSSHHRKSTKGMRVNFNTRVMVARLPESEADDAWRARFGPWRSAPTHDFIWDGIANAMRARELSIEEFKALTYELKLQRILPKRIASALATRKHSKLILKKARKASLKGMGKRSTRGSDASTSSEASVVTETDQGVNITVASGKKTKIKHRRGSGSSGSGGLDSMSSENDIVQLDRYFSQVERLDGLKKPELPQRNYSWTEELLRMTVDAVHAEDKENATPMLPSTPETGAVRGRANGNAEDDSDEFKMLLLRLRDPEEHKRTTSVQLSAVEVAALSSPSSTSTAYGKWQEGGVAVHGGKRGTISALSMALVEDIYDAVVQLSGLGDL